MINTVSDLLHQIILKEKQVLDRIEITHGPTIGDMYEGLAEDILNKALFRGLDIRVVSGFVVNEKNELSNEVDCMIVEGEGEIIPYTDKYKYKYSQVIAVLEIKKNLYKEEIMDAYNKMRKVYTLSENETILYKAFEDSFRGIVGKEVPEREELLNLSTTEQMVYHSLLVQQQLPIRIIFGFDGYKNEFTLRKGFLDYLNSNLGESGYSPVSFPDLIISGENSLIKNTGMPYVYPINEKEEWLIYGSTSINPINVLLEFIWTRLAYKYSISSDIFGDDLEIESVNPLLYAKPVKIKGEVKGWNFNAVNLTLKQLNNGPKFIDWSPTKLNDDEAVLMNILCAYSPLLLTSKLVRDIPPKIRRNVIRSLTEKRLINTNGKYIYLLTKECKVMNHKGQWYAGEDNSGRLMRWVLKENSK